MTSKICFQAVHQAAAASWALGPTRCIYLKTFSPALLRKALRQAGNVVAPHDIAEVLHYVISDHQYGDLDKLHLVLLRDGSVQQLRYGPAPNAPDQPKEKQYFIWQATRTRELYDLMPASQHEQVEDAPAWRQIAK